VPLRQAGRVGINQTRKGTQKLLTRKECAPPKNFQFGLVGWLGDGPRVNGLNIRIPRKIPIIKRKNALHTVNSHECHQSGVMHLHSGHSVRHQEFAPLLMHRKAVREQPKFFFRKIWPGGPSLPAKGRSHFDPPDEYTCSRTPQHSGMYSKECRHVGGFHPWLKLWRDNRCGRA
jgi:hypothetical protein